MKTSCVGFLIVNAITSTQGDNRINLTLHTAAAAPYMYQAIIYLSNNLSIKLMGYNKQLEKKNSLKTFQ